MRHHLALVVCLAFAGSVVHAAPARRADRHGKLARHAKHRAPPVAEPEANDEPRADDNAAEEPRLPKRAERKAARLARKQRDAEAIDDDESEAPRPTKRRGKAAREQRDVEAIDDAAESEAPRLTKRAGRKAARLAHAREQTVRDGDRTDDADETEAPRRTKRAGGKAVRSIDEPAERDSDRVALRGESTDAEDSVDDTDADAEILDAPVRVRAVARPRAKGWHVAVGPYLWASSVDANVSLGPASVSSGVDFFDLQRHARYGAEVLAEAGYGRFSIYGDLMYGVVDVDGATAVGPLMVTLSGTASSLLVDGTAGYLLAGSGRSLLALEARAGVRYQRTAIAGSVDVAGADVSPPAHVDAAADALAGAHAVLRPSRRFELSGTFDLGVFGGSTTTWSALADASLRVTSHLRLSVGWRTLTTERANVSIVMHGPRAAVQAVF